MNDSSYKSVDTCHLAAFIFLNFRIFFHCHHNLLLIALSKFSMPLYSSRIKHISEITEIETITVWTNKPRWLSLQWPTWPMTASAVACRVHSLLLWSITSFLWLWKYISWKFVSWWCLFCFGGVHSWHPRGWVIVQCQPEIHNFHSQMNLYSEMCLITLCLSAASPFLKDLPLRGWQRFTLPFFVQGLHPCGQEPFLLFVQEWRVERGGDMSIINISAEVPVLLLFFQEA